MVFQHVPFLQSFCSLKRCDACAGGQSVSNPLKVTPVTSLNDLLHMLVAVSHAQQADQLLSANIAGFVWISSVDPVQQTVTYLAPCAGDLPAPFLLAGTVKTFLR